MNKTFLKDNKLVSIEMVDKQLHNLDDNHHIINCFWDHHPIYGKKYGRPIKTHEPLNIINYQSVNNAQNYVFTSLNTSDTKLTYITEDYFCSLSCLKAYIQENKLEQLYLRQIEKCCNIDVKPAPHWRELSVYGGSKNIEEFRGIKL